MIRFVHHFNYADGVTREEGDAWYLNEHASQARKLPGLVGYVSWPQVAVGLPLPVPHDQFVRRSELRFEGPPNGSRRGARQPGSVGAF